MKITIQMIRDEFGPEVAGCLIHTPNSAAKVEMCSIFEPGCITKENFVYIVREQDLHALTENEYKGAFLVLLEQLDVLTEDQKEILQNMGIDLVLLKNENVSHVLQRVQELLGIYNKWEIEMYKAAGGNRVQDIAKTAASFIKNPVFLYSTSLKLICCLNLTETAENFFNEIEDYETQFEGKYVPPKYRDRLCREPFQKSGAVRNAPHLSGSESLGYRTLAYNIILNNTYVARIVICEVENKIQESDFFVLKTLGDFLAPYLGSQDMDVGTHPAGFDMFLHQRLAGDSISNPGTPASALEAFGWVERDTYICCCIPVNQETSSVDFVMKVCFSIEESISGSAALIHDHNIVHMINLALAKGKRDQVLRKLQTLYKDLNLRAGISPAFIGLDQLRERFKQALVAYELGEQENTDDMVHQYADYNIKDMMQIIKREYSIDTLCPYEIEKLMEYDRNRNMHLTETLKTYLKNDRNIARSIRLLYMQRATFLYQLNRITEITGLDLDDYNIRLYLQMYFAATQSDNKGK